MRSFDISDEGLARESSVNEGFIQLRGTANGAVHPGK